MQVRRSSSSSSSRFGSLMLGSVTLPGSLKRRRPVMTASSAEKRLEAAIHLMGQIHLVASDFAFMTPWQP